MNPHAILWRCHRGNGRKSAAWFGSCGRDHSRRPCRAERRTGRSAERKAKAAKEIAKGSLADPDNRRIQIASCLPPRRGGLSRRRHGTPSLQLDRLEFRRMLSGSFTALSAGSVRRDRGANLRNEIALRGIVLTSHPGYGMGVAFEFEDERRALEGRETARFRCRNDRTQQLRQSNFQLSC